MSDGKNCMLIIIPAVVYCFLSLTGCNGEDAYCKLPEGLVDEIASYRTISEKIINTSIRGNFKNFTFNALADFVDQFGSRMAGSENLENAIDYMLTRSKKFNLDNVHGEEVKIPKWVRGNESAWMISPRRKQLAILGLGYSVATPPEGVTAQVLVVKSFQDLTAKANQAKGKIVVYNQDFVSYGETVKYRSKGATEASRVGAVASLIRSVTPFSMNTPHTGMQSYGEGVHKIPTACITVEDAELLQRLQDRGESLKITLRMDARMYPDVMSRNTVAELQGREEAAKVVLVSGHLDSWDVGNGAMDDGGGAFISWASLVLLKQLNLRPRRTIRAILWTAEEMGLVGAQGYKMSHQNESHNFNFIMESDEGTFKPLGIEFSAGSKGGCILNQVMRLLEPINATRAVKRESVGSDIEIWTSEGIPGASLLNKNEKYFWFHHTEADSLDVEDSASLDENTALWATVAYVLADLKEDFPRD